MDATQYILDLLSRPIVPSYCAWPAWLGVAFRMDDYSNFTREVEIIHCPDDARATPHRNCRFVAQPINIVQSGHCPVCGRTEVTPFNPQERRELNAKEAYRRIVKAYSDRAMRYYLIQYWDNLRSINKGRLHIDHIFPVSRGYDEEVPEIVIGSPVNCRLVAKRHNLRKATKPGQSLDQLRRRYEAFIAEFPEWAESANVLATTGNLVRAHKPKTRLQNNTKLAELIEDPLGEQEVVSRLTKQASTVTRKSSRSKKGKEIGVVIHLSIRPAEDQS